jgi:flagellar FliJ protein
MAQHSYEVIRSLKAQIEEEAELAAKLLAHAMKQDEEAKSRFALLDQYHQGYKQSFNQALTAGLGSETYRNYQGFLAKLSDAIETQKNVVVSTEYQVGKHRSHWQQLQKKKLSYEVLTKRADGQMALTAKKRDQKLMDEYAARISRKRAIAW